MKRLHWKRFLLCGTAAIALLGFSVTASANFIGYYDVSNWTVTHVPDATTDSGSVDTSGAPASVTVIGSDNGSGDQTRIEFWITAEAAGNVSFDWAYESLDTSGSAFWDPAGYLLGIAPMPLTGTNPVDGGSFSFAVSAGQVFGFYVETLDNGFGEARLTIGNFNGPTGPPPPSVPEPASVALVALGLLAMAAMRRRPAR